MFDIAWSEFFLVGVVALVAIGPKDLPKAMYMLGRLAGQARRFAADIRQQFDQLAYEAEIAAKQTDKSETDNQKNTTTPPDSGVDRES